MCPVSLCRGVGTGWVYVAASKVLVVDLAFLIESISTKKKGETT